MAVTPSRLKEAERTLQARGIEKPSISAKYTEARRIDQERNFQTAQQKVGQTKLKAQTPTVRRAFTTPIGLPQAGGTGVLPRRSIMAQSASFTPATYDQPSVTEISPVTQRTGGVSTQIAPAPPRTLGFTPDAFELQLRNALQNELAAQTGQLRGALQTSTGQFLSTPETIASLPGFENLTIDQLRGLQGAERRGLGALISGVGGLAEQRQSQFKESLAGAVGAFEKRQEAMKPGSINEFASKQFGYLVDDKGRAILDVQGKTIDLPAQSDAELVKRRDTARSKFLALREAIGKKGLTLDPGAGERYLQEFETTDNPEKVLNQYMLDAFSVPAVKAAFKKGGGISIKIPGFFKELEYVGSLTDEQIESAKEASGILKEIKGTGITNPFE